MEEHEGDAGQTMGTFMEQSKLAGRATSGTERPDLDPFALVERVYRLSNTPQSVHVNKKARRAVPVELSQYPDLVDFSDLERNSPQVRALIREVEPLAVTSKYFHKTPKVYTLTNHEGIADFEPVLMSGISTSSRR